MYLSSEATDVTASLTYLGPYPWTTVQLPYPRGIRFVISGGYPHVSLEGERGRYGCKEVTLFRGAPFDVPLANVSDPPEPISLPANIWDIEASTAIYRSSCYDDPIPLIASIKLEVRDDMAVPMIDLATRADWADQCIDRELSGVLTRDTATGLGTRAAPGRPIRDVLWPLGFAARVQNGVATLMDRSGKAVAREGDRVRLGGGINRHNRYVPCDAVEVLPSVDAAG
ncbi:MAG TPA: hypothetical protein VJ850_06395 [Candidatus Limnocylindrales bacterium]|nr:hypothetical protein [Candidatus Limnocylindrales bacterium]